MTVPEDRTAKGATMSGAPARSDVLYDITRYLSAPFGGDRAYLVQQSRFGMGLVIAATDIDSMERSDWELVLRPRINAPDPFPED